MPIAIDNIILVIIVTKKQQRAKVKVKEIDPTWSQILFFPVTIILF